MIDEIVPHARDILLIATDDVLGWVKFAITVFFS